MKVITLMSPKGGVSKSTLITNLAVEASRTRNTKVLIIDTDNHQWTSERWFQRRPEDKKMPDAVRASGNEIAKTCELAKEHEFDYVFIDTAGRDAPLVKIASSVSDLCLIPSGPSYADIEEENLSPVIDSLKLQKKPYFFVLSKQPSHKRRTEETAMLLSDFGDIAPCNIQYRVVYMDALALGLAVTEMGLSKETIKARLEVRNLWKWLKKTLNR